MKINKSLLLLSFCALPCFGNAEAQTQPSDSGDNNVIFIEPLFNYPVAPEEIISLGDKSNWLMEHFWDSFDFKSKKAVDQNALNDAFSVYAQPMLWADRDAVLKSTDKLLSNISKNPVMMLQFTKAAEENLYGPRATAYIDEVYIKYLEALNNMKKIKPERKARYNRQYKILKKSMVGVIPPVFEFETVSGAKETFRPGLLTVIEFGDPDCTDCRLSKLKMDTDLKFSSLVEKGKINVLFIIPDAEEGWQEMLADYPKLWHCGASDTVSDILDMRATPYFYVVGTDGKIITKTDNIEKAMTTAIDSVK